jgi:hypothetical protein
MKTNHIKIVLFLALVVSLTNCAIQKTTSTIVGCEYNEKTNTTDYFVFPYGSVTIPGKWERTNYLASSKQQFFRNRDSVSLAISFVRFNKYEFNRNGEKSGFEFIKSFYEWDSNYFVESQGLKRQSIETDSTNNFIIYRIYGQKETANINTYFLVAEKKGDIANFSITNVKKWEENEKINFLKAISLTRK